MRRRLILVPALLFAFACDQPADEPATTAPDEATSRRAVEQLRDNWVAAEARDDAAAIAALYAEDAVFVTTEGGVARGRAAIQEALAQSFPMSTLDNVTSQRLTVAGDLAHDYGEFTQRFTPQGAPQQTIRGHYSVALQRQADGSWQIISHLSTTPQPRTQSGARPATQPAAPAARSGERPAAETPGQ